MEEKEVLLAKVTGDKIIFPMDYLVSVLTW